MASRAPAYKPSVGPRPVVGGVAAGPSIETVRAAGLQTNLSPKSAAQLNAERLEMMRRRREAIRAKFNK